MPERHRGDADEVTYENALDSEMADESDGIVIGTDCSVYVAVALVSMLCKQSIQTVIYVRGFCVDAAFVHDGVCAPFVFIIHLRDFGPVGGTPVPGDHSSAVSVRAKDTWRKLLEPVESSRGLAELFEREGGGSLGTAERGDVEVVDVVAVDDVREQLRFRVAARGERVMFVIRVAVSYDDDSQGGLLSVKQEMFLTSLYYNPAEC